ncbi:MAG: hypothetical protein K2N94_02910 [Lachnospiraceae bacterium]|nr:hypothetical protein [Lachnospiraceae bacterium]
MLKKRFSFEKYFPPGYEYSKERNTAGFLLGFGAVMSLHFFKNLLHAADRLYDHVQWRRVLRAGAVAPPFRQLVEDQWMLYIPLFLFLASMMLYHYFYYFHTTKSIYLMRRLPKRSVLFKSCVQGPLLYMGASAALLGVLYLSYYGAYRLVIPAECLP